MNKLEIYKDGRVLQEDEWLLKIRKNVSGRGNDLLPTGFMTKLTQKGVVPVRFQDWPTYEKNIPIYVIREEPREGWKFVGMRFGESQNWAVMLHPEGFTIEIYAENFKEVILKNDLLKGELQGIFSWKNNKLTKA